MMMLAFTGASFVLLSFYPLESILSVTSKEETTHAIINIVNIDGLGYSDHLRIQGDYAYLANETLDGLVIYDISNPASLSVAGSVQDHTYLDNAECVYVKGNYAAVLGFGYLTIVDVSNPASPSVVDHTNYDYEKLDAGTLWVEDGYAYCASNYGDTLSIVDVSAYFPLPAKGGGGGALPLFAKILM